MGKKIKRHQSKNHNSRKSFGKTLSISISPNSSVSRFIPIDSSNSKTELLEQKVPHSNDDLSFSKDILESFNKEIGSSTTKTEIELDDILKPDLSLIDNFGDFQISDKPPLNTQDISRVDEKRIHNDGKLKKKSASPNSYQEYKKFSIIKSNTFDVATAKSASSVLKQPKLNSNTKDDILGIAAEPKGKVFSRFLKRGYKWKDKFSKEPSNSVDVYEFIKSPSINDEISNCDPLKSPNLSPSNFNTSSNSPQSVSPPILTLNHINTHISLGASKRKSIASIFSPSISNKSTYQPSLDQDLNNQRSLNNSNSSIKESSYNFSSGKISSSSNSVSIKDSSGSFESSQINPSHKKKNLMTKIKKLAIGASSSNSPSSSNDSSSKSNQSLKKALNDISNSNSVPKRGRNAFIYSGRGSILPQNHENNEKIDKDHEPSSNNDSIKNVSKESKLDCIPQPSIGSDEILSNNKSSNISNFDFINDSFETSNSKNEISISFDKNIDLNNANDSSSKIAENSEPNLAKVDLSKNIDNKHLGSTDIPTYLNSPRISKPTYESLNSEPNFFSSNGATDSHLNFLNENDMHKKTENRVTKDDPNPTKKNNINAELRSKNRVLPVSESLKNEDKNCLNLKSCIPIEPPYKKALDHRENELKKLIAHSGNLETWKYAIPLENYDALEESDLNASSYLGKHKFKGGLDKGNGISNWKNGFFDVFNKSRAKSFIVGDSGKNHSNQVSESPDRGLNDFGQRSRMKSMLSSDSTSSFPKIENSLRSPENFDLNYNNIDVDLHISDLQKTNLASNSYSLKPTKVNSRNRKNSVFSGFSPDKIKKSTQKAKTEAIPDTSNRISNICKEPFDRKVLLDSKETIFGLSLKESVEKSQLIPNIMLPAVVIRCIEYLELHGLKEVGIYRVSGSYKTVNTLKSMFTPGRDIDFKALHLDIHSISTLLKMYLRELPESILTDNLMHKFIDLDSVYPIDSMQNESQFESSKSTNTTQSAEIDISVSKINDSNDGFSTGNPNPSITSKKNGTSKKTNQGSITPSSEVCSNDKAGFKRLDIKTWVQELRKLIYLLPIENQTLLKWLFSHLSRVVYYSEENKMTLSNLGLIFCTTLEIRSHIFFELCKNSDILFNPSNNNISKPPRRKSTSNNSTFPSIHRSNQINKNDHTFPKPPISHLKSKSEIDAKLSFTERKITELSSQLQKRNIFNSNKEANSFSRWVMSGKLSWLRIIDAGYLNDIMGEISFLDRSERSNSRSGSNPKLSLNTETFSNFTPPKITPDLLKTNEDEPLSPESKQTESKSEFNLKNSANMLSSVGAGYATQHRRKLSESPIIHSSVANKILQWELNTASTSSRTKNRMSKKFNYSSSTGSLYNENSELNENEFFRISKSKNLNSNMTTRSANSLLQSSPSLFNPFSENYSESMDDNSNPFGMDFKNYSIKNSSKQTKHPKALTNSTSFPHISSKQNVVKNSKLVKKIKKFDDMVTLSELKLKTNKILNSKESNNTFSQQHNEPIYKNNSKQHSIDSPNVSTETQNFNKDLPIKLRKTQSMNLSNNTDFNFDFDSDSEADDSDSDNIKSNRKGSIYSKLNLSSISNSPLSTPTEIESSFKKNLNFNADFNHDNISKPRSNSEIPQRSVSEPISEPVNENFDFIKLMDFDFIETPTMEKANEDNTIIDCNINVYTTSESGSSTPENADVSARVIEKNMPQRNLRKSKHKINGNHSLKHKLPPKSPVAILVNNKEISLESDESNSSGNNILHETHA
ncbi:putative Rho-type GTPase-activating protein 2 [Smittium culicis]|uniref:Putative Rho-type GTPase-activating protein 2 n=1 Tax=Smittium culicis TaxID=133412 RepID=A0A1R1YIG5_9FUNG|nr:putative Rho-type GTPase-activating protein 2 [Smittium culicis]